MSFFDSRDVAEASPGLPERWLRGVPVVWQEQIMEADRHLRLTWSNRLGRWGLVRRAPGHTQFFDDGVLEGWSLVKWYAATWRPEQMLDHIAGMHDAHQFATPEKAWEDIQRRERESREKMTAEMNQNVSDFADDFFANDAAALRDAERERTEALDNTSRAHAHTKVGGVVGGLV